VERVILHCDLNSFYASVELLDYPALREKPVAVCGDPGSRHGIILAKNEAAKKFKIQTAETVWQARRKCPDLILLPAHHQKYLHWSKVINAIYERYTDLVEPFSVDESWLDVTGTLHLFGKDGKALADEIRRVVRTETGLTISVGVSFNKVLAKLGSDMKKPDATTVITPADLPAKVFPLPITDMLFVGRASAKVLGQYGIHTIGDAVAFGREGLVGLLGKSGSSLYDNCAGLEHAPVRRREDMPSPKSIGNSITFRRNLLGEEDIRAGLALLADSVAGRLRRHGFRCATLHVLVKDPNFQSISRQRRLDRPVCTAAELSELALDILRGCWNFNAPIRQLGLTGQNLVPEEDAGEQLDLFAPQTAPQGEKREKVERAMDDIRRRFGKDAITSALILHENIDRPEESAGSIPPGAH